MRDVIYERSLNITSFISGPPKCFVLLEKKSLLWILFFFRKEEQKRRIMTKIDRLEWRGWTFEFKSSFETNFEQIKINSNLS